MNKQIFNFNLIGILFFATIHSHAAYKPDQSFLHPSRTIVLGSSDYSTDPVDDTEVLQQAIDDVHEAGGGHVVIPGGDYQLTAVIMRSNVHVIFKGKTTLHPLNSQSRGMNLFSFGMTKAIKNASLIGSESPVIFDFTQCPSESGFRAVILGECDNFRIANITINDNRTVFSSVTLTWCGTKDGIAQVPRNGLIEDIIANDADYGYGSIQAHSGEQIIFRNIKSVGGVAVRLETGYAKMNKARSGGLFDITVENSLSVNGQGSLFFQPHTMVHGDIVARNIQSDGSEFCVYIGVPFVSKKKFGEGATLPPGTYKSIRIDGVKAIYRDGPNVMRYGHLKYVPKELYHLVTKNGKTYHGPSIAAVGLMNPLITNVTINDVDAIGFKYQKDIITPDDSTRRKQ